MIDVPERQRATGPADSIQADQRRTWGGEGGGQWALVRLEVERLLPSRRANAHLRGDPSPAAAKAAADATDDDDDDEDEEEDDEVDSDAYGSDAAAAMDARRRPFLAGARACRWAARGAAVSTARRHASLSEPLSEESPRPAQPRPRLRDLPRPGPARPRPVARGLLCGLYSEPSSSLLLRGPMGEGLACLDVRRRAASVSASRRAYLPQSRGRCA